MKQFCLLLLSFYLSVTSFSQTITISGRAFFDNNRNQVYDVGDSAFKQGYIDITGLYFHSVITDSTGQYETQLTPGYYSISMRPLYNLTIYGQVGSFNKIIEESEVDTIYTIDFPISKRPAVEVFSLYCANKGEHPKSTGGNITYILNPYFQGTADSMYADVSFEYDTLTSFVSSSIPPTNHTHGKLTWNSQKLKKSGLIEVTLQMPIVGDTIETIKHKGILRLYNDTISKSSSQQLIEKIAFVSEAPGKTKGLKWLRNFTSTGHYYNFFADAVDTALGGLEYYVVGEKEDENLDVESFLIKTKSDGLSTWERNLTNYVDDSSKYFVYNVIGSKDGGCFVGGCNPKGYDTLRGYDELTDILILKFDADGGLEWKKSIAGSRSDGGIIELMGMAESQDGSLIISGNTYSSDGDFANNNPDTLHANLYVTKLSSSGNFIWSKIYGGSHTDACLRLKALSDGSFIVLAITESKDGDVQGAHDHKFLRTYDDYFGTDSIFTREAWVLHLDANGNMIWNRCMGGTESSFITGVVENNGGLLFAGYTNSKDGDLHGYAGRYLPVWLVQTDMNGQILWQKQYEEYAGYNHKPLEDFDIYFAHIYSGLYKQVDGSVILAGNITDRYGPLKARHGKEDIFIANFSAAGNLIWEKTIGGTNDDYVTEICVDAKGDIIVAGGSLSHDDDLYGLHQDVAAMLAKFGPSNIISGSIFIDENGNHVHDHNEPFVNDGIIKSIYNSDTIIAVIDKGNFLANVDTGTYVSRYVNCNDYFTPFPDSAISIFSSFDQEDSISFALVPKPGIHDLEVSIIPLDIPRPGFDANYKILTKNVGTETINNVVIKLAKSSKVNFINADRGAASVSIDSIAFQPITLNVGAKDELNVHCKLAAPPILNNGDTLVLTAVAYPLLNDTTPVNNTSTLSQIARGSFDPNDKSESHAGIYTSFMKTNGEPFQYQIRFQNTGTDTAFYITVKDTLDRRLDLASLEMINSSHPYEFSIEENIITWHFEMIKLVDSTTDDANSHGFISFRINPKETWNVGDVVANKAAIYFDYNLPVVTNEALVTFISPGCPVGNTWNGTVSSAWENPANWSCAVVPDINTQVFINAGTPFQPEVNTTTATCKSIQLQSGAHVWIKAGANLDVKGN